MNRKEYESQPFMSNNPRHIRKWMNAHIADYIDECDEVNSTKLVEAWDRECASGEATLDPNHIAWDIGAEIAIEHEKQKK